MYTILVDDDNELVTTVKERIMQRSILVNTLRFLVPPSYQSFDMSEFTVTLEYCLPISRRYGSRQLIRSGELYKDMLEYRLPLDTVFTQESGTIELQLTFTHIVLTEAGESVQYVRKTSAAAVCITPIAAWSDLIPDGALTSLDQRIVKLDALTRKLDELQQGTLELKADNLALDQNTKELYLTAGGQKIGSSVPLGTLGDEIAESTEAGLVKVII